MTRSKKITFIFAVIVVASLLTACTLDRRVEVEAGTYVVAPGGGAANLIAREAVREISIDRERQILTIFFLDGSDLKVPFSPRARGDWPAGCPGNINSTRMEVLDLDMNPLSIASLKLDEPILVRNCPPDPVSLVLREGGDVGGSATACSNPDACVFFESP